MEAMIQHGAHCLRVCNRSGVCRCGGRYAEQALAVPGEHAVRVAKGGALRLPHAVDVLARLAA